MIGSCFVLNSKSELFEANVSGKASLKGDGSELVRDLLRSPEVTSRLKPDDFITVIINLAHGLAVTQRILGAELSQKSTRSLVQLLFDHLISSALIFDWP